MPSIAPLKLNDLLSGLKAIWVRDRDPFLSSLRWRLHLRLLLISAALSFGFFIHNLINAGPSDMLIGVGLPLAAWFFLHRFPRYNRWVVRGVLAVFVTLGLRTIWMHGPESFPAELLALMIMPVFATLLDGIATGAIVVSVAEIATITWLFRNGRLGSGNTLEVAFCMVASAGLYFCCVAHTWIFTTLVEQRRQSTLATLTTRNAVERLAAALSDSVVQLTNRLKLDLAEKGLQGLDAAKQLNVVLKQARDQRPPEIPQNPLVPFELLQNLRRSALSVFLLVAASLSSIALGVMLCIAPALWQLAVAMTLVSAFLFRGSRQDRHWHWRLRIFVTINLATCLLDSYLSSRNPPAGSLVFIPVIVYFSAMLDDFWAAALSCAAAVAVVIATYQFSEMSPSYAHQLATVGMILPALLAVSAATLPMYRILLEQLGVEEYQLSQELAAYRRLVSTFFHDLANPLAVLQSLAMLPPALQTPEDRSRALRMAQRIDLVATSARQTLLGAAPLQTQSTLKELSDELYDLFKERLREKEQKWVLSSGSNLRLRQNGPLLRDSVLGNLLSNAVKFSPPGSKIELKAWNVDGAVHLQVSDTGRGIPQKVLNELDLGRSPQSLKGTEGETGSGFGLLLAKTYMAELGGKLLLRSRPSGGTEAELVLPQG